MIKVMIWFSFFARFPIAIVAVVGFVLHKSWWWLLVFILFIIAENLIETSFTYFNSFKEFRNFKEQFLDVNRNFILLKDEQLDEVIDKNEFSIAALKNRLVNKIMLQSDEGFELTSKPVQVFYAKPVKDILLSSCKAYVYGLGLFFIVHRTSKIRNNIFEKFLLLHEIEHINDRGYVSNSRLMLTKYFLCLNLVVFLFFAQNFVDYAFIAFYALFMYYQRFSNLTINREIIADGGAIDKFKDYKDQVKVIDLLIHIFEMTIKKNGNIFGLFEAKARLIHVQERRQNILDINNGESPRFNLLRHHPIIVENNIGVIAITIMSFWMFRHVTFDPFLLIKVLVGIIAVNVFFRFIFVWVSRKMVIGAEALLKQQNIL